MFLKIRIHPYFLTIFFLKKTVTFDFGTLEATLFYEIKSNRMPVSPGYPWPWEFHYFNVFRVKWSVYIWPWDRARVLHSLHFTSFFHNKVGTRHAPPSHRKAVLSRTCIFHKINLCRIKKQEIFFAL